MDLPLYRHVLFKDLEPYLRKTDYFKGFTTTELAWARKNLGAASESEMHLLLNHVSELTYSEIYNLILTKSLIPGTLYIITDFLTIYLSDEQNDDGTYITWGKTINPSEIYKIVTFAITNSSLLSSAAIISNDPDSLNWTVLYDATSEKLSDGEITKGKITYLLDTNFNLATYDFKNIQYKLNGLLRHILNDDYKNINNNLCYCDHVIFTNLASNNTIYGKNVVINVPVNHLIGELNNTKIDTQDISLDDETIKTTILVDGKYNIDYLDLETLTHLFYALANNIYIT